MTTPETWQLWGYNGSSPSLVDLTDRVILPTGSHNPDTRTGEDCMSVTSMESALRLLKRQRYRSLYVPRRAFHLKSLVSKAKMLA